MKRKNVLLAFSCACVLAVSAAPAAVLADETEVTTENETDADVIVEDDTEEETEAETEAARPTYTALDYAVLGEYKGLTVQVDSAEVTDEEVLAEAEDLISYSDAVEWLTEGTVQDGDTVDITYVGTLDGEEFDGGSGDYELEIGSGTFIDGFEEGLIGVEVGETVDLDLTFPEDYYYDDLAGQAVVFTVTVNSIMSVPELSDEVVETATDGEYTDVDSYLEYIRSYLEEDAEDTWLTNVQEALYTALAACSEVTEYPQDLVDYCMDDAVAYYELIASYYSMEYADFIETYFGSEETFMGLLESAVEESLQQELLLMAVAETEGMEISDEEYQEGLERYAEYYGFETAEEVEEYYSKEDLMRYFLMDKVYEFLQENAVIEEISEEETETETETEA
ncbi:MAG: trigger factor [Lachnospiraceae bacterium]|nr:trigger factor [Lachnospiraceae bacterium]